MPNNLSPSFLQGSIFHPPKIWGNGLPQFHLGLFQVPGNQERSTFREFLSGNKKNLPPALQGIFHAHFFPANAASFKTGTIFKVRF